MDLQASEPQEGSDESATVTPAPATKVSKHRGWLHKLNTRRLRLWARMTPQQHLVMGFLGYTVFGWLLLCLPWMHRGTVAWLDHLFIATSAISTTGLVTVSLADHYTWLGQFVVMALIQVGGVGYMTLTSFFLLSNRNNLAHWNQRILNAEFALPKGFHIHDFLRSVVMFTAIVEIVGAALFYMAFRGYGMASGEALWSAIFHSVSSFCTAGFGLYNDSFESFHGDYLVNATIIVLSSLGAIGFIVVTDAWNLIRRRTPRITFTTKVILGMFGFLVMTGTLGLFFFESSIRSLPLAERSVTALFQAMTALTTVGFNTVPIGALATPMLLLLIFLMYVGASPSGTGGGMKSTTLTAVAAVMWSRIRGDRRVTFFGSQIPLERVYVATSSFIFYTALIFLGTFLLSFIEPQPLTSLLFEMASALGTVGLSMGITGSLTVGGKALIILAMFVGRLGVLTFGFALLSRRKPHNGKEETKDLAV